MYFIVGRGGSIQPPLLLVGSYGHTSFSVVPPLVPHITVWGSCFSLCTRRSFRIPPRLLIPPRRLLSHHLSHLTPHHSTPHHTTSSHKLLTAQPLTLIIRQPLTSNSSHSNPITQSQPPPHHTALITAQLMAFVWQAQDTEPSGGAGVRVDAAGPRLAFV